MRSPLRLLVSGLLLLILVGAAASIVGSPELQRQTGALALLLAGPAIQLGIGLQLRRQEPRCREATVYLGAAAAALACVPTALLIHEGALLALAAIQGALLLLGIDILSHRSRWEHRGTENVVSLGMGVAVLTGVTVVILIVVGGSR